MYLELFIIMVINTVAILTAIAVWAGIKKVSIATGKGFWATIKFVFLSPVKFIKWSKQARKNKKEFKQARAYKKIVEEAVFEFLLGEWAENRPEIQNHPKVKNHKEMAEAVKAMKQAEANLKQLANKKKSK